MSFNQQPEVEKMPAPNMEDVIQQRSDTVEEDDMMHSNMMDDDADPIA